MSKNMLYHLYYNALYKFYSTLDFIEPFLNMLKKLKIFNIFIVYVKKMV